MIHYLVSAINVRLECLEKHFNSAVSKITAISRSRASCIFTPEFFALSFFASPRFNLLSWLIFEDTLVKHYEQPRSPPLEQPSYDLGANSFNRLQSLYQLRGVCTFKQMTTRFQSDDPAAMQAPS